MSMREWRDCRKLVGWVTISKHREISNPILLPYNSNFPTQDGIPPSLGSTGLVDSVQDLGWEIPAHQESSV